MSSSSPSRRKEADLMRLGLSRFPVKVGDDTTEFEVSFDGPEETPYAGGTWNVRVELPPDYPFSSPSIGFLTPIFHPNIDFRSGTVCLDVINQTWSPMFDLVNIFESFLPQLLRYPNPTDPLNGEAAALHLADQKAYDARVAQLVAEHATKSAEDDDDDADDQEMGPPAAGRAGAATPVSTPAPTSSSATATATPSAAEAAARAGGTSTSSGSGGGNSPDEDISDLEDAGVEEDVFDGLDLDEDF